MLNKYIDDHPFDEYLAALGKNGNSNNLYTMYHILFCDNRIDLIKQMIYSSEKITNDDKYILINATYRNNHEIITILMSKSINLNKEIIIKGEKFGFLLDIAIAKKNKNLCDFLIQNGCDIYVDNCKLIIKCIQNDCDFIKYFMLYISDVNVLLEHIYINVKIILILIN